MMFTDVNVDRPSGDPMFLLIRLGCNLRLETRIRIPPLPLLEMLINNTYYIIRMSFYVLKYFFIYEAPSVVL